MIEQRHAVDGKFLPAGGKSWGLGFTIEWQDGPLREQGTDERAEPNGAFVEDLMSLLIERLQTGQFPTLRTGIEIDWSLVGDYTGLVQATYGRVEWYQGEDGRGRFSCRENSITITHLQDAEEWLGSRTGEDADEEADARKVQLAIYALEHALLWQRRRTRLREERGVEGTHTA